MRGIFCGCEGPLAHVGNQGVCIRCQRTYPSPELEQIVKLLLLAEREFDNDGKPANENVRRLALNKAATKLAKLGLRVMDMANARPPAPPPPPTPPPVYRTPATWTSTTTTFSSPMGVNVVFRVTIG